MYFSTRNCIFFPLILFIFFLSGCMPMYQRHEKIPVTIAVGLTLSTNRLEIVPTGAYTIYEGARVKGTLDENCVYVCGIYKGKRVVICKDKIYDEEITLKGNTGDEMIAVNGNRYRGNLRIIVKDNMFSVVNEVNVDDYVYGVIPSEISPKWPEEVIKAQAVAARTYALANRGRHKQNGFDLCDKEHCQVYRGVDGEDAHANVIIDETRGEIVAYDGNCASIVYHANCGGHTENIVHVWPSASRGEVPYLRGKRCPFCRDGYQHDWKRSLTYQDITTALRSSRYNAGNICKVNVKSFCKSGSVKELSLSWGDGATVISGPMFRSMFGLKSTKFEIEEKKEGIFLEGSGAGHGVGMCQDGAKRMAERSYSYTDILYFYFPGTEVVGWERIN